MQPIYMVEPNLLRPGTEPQSPVDKQRVRLYSGNALSVDAQYFEEASKRIVEWSRRYSPGTSIVLQDAPSKPLSELWIHDLEEQKRLKQTFSPEKTCASSFMRLQIDGRWPGLRPLDDAVANGDDSHVYRASILFTFWADKSVQQVLNKELERYLSILGPATDLKKLDRGLSVLHIAALQLRPRCAKLLLRHNADIRIKSHDGQDPMSYLCTEIKSRGLSFKANSDQSKFLQQIGKTFIFNGITKFRYGYVSFMTIIPHERILELPSKEATWNGMKKELISLQEQYEALNDNLCAIKWIHVMLNDAAMVDMIGKKLDKKSGIPKRFFGSWESPISFQNEANARHKIPHCSSTRLASRSLDIVFPFLSLRTPASLKIQEEVLHHSHPMPEPSWLWSDVQKDRTLDEAYYPGLGTKAMDIRNRDQVVTKHFVAGLEEVQRPILIVSQLWMWNEGNTVLSACPELHSTFSNYFTGLGLDRAPKWVEFPEDLMVSLIAQKVHDFGVGVKSIDGEKVIPPTLSIFEVAVVSTLTKVDEYMAQYEFDAAAEYKFIHEISDIRDELPMIADILAQQEDVIAQILRCFEGDSELEERAKKNIRPLLKTAEKEILGYKNRIRKVDNDAQRIEQVIQNKLNLRRTEASINEAQHARLLSLSVFGFTIITFIFTPLSFIASLLALDMDWFKSIKHPSNPSEIDGSGDELYKGSKVIGVFLGTEFLAIFLTIILGYGAYWSFNHVFEKELFDFRPKIVSTTLNKLLNIKAREQATADETMPNKPYRKSKATSAPAIASEQNRETAATQADSSPAASKRSFLGFMKRRGPTETHELP